MGKTISTLVAVLICLPFPPNAGALAISAVELKSFLIQPLNARVYLLAANEDELTSLNIRVTNINDATGNQRNAVLRYEIKENEQGHYINITSRDAIREPLLNFMLELNWSAGHLIREYSLLIDPQ
ncbi:MAG: FimV family protein [Gammaproteobacteria bacterium]